MAAKIDADDEDLKALASHLQQALESMGHAWDIGMKCLRINEREYRAICRAGKSVETAITRLASLAEERDIPEEDYDGFLLRKSYGFN
ncbi:MAG: hypothetical protein V9G63_10015 [Candidatus Competibacter sp.]|jgi:hypothetical protein